MKVGGKTSTKMKVQKLIDLLNKVENKESNVVISIRQYNKVHPVAYIPVITPEYDKLIVRDDLKDPEVRIQVTLPHDADSFMYTGTKTLC